MSLMTSSLDWLLPAPEHGWTADDLDTLPSEAPRHVELLDGSLVVRDPQTKFHMLVINLLLAGIHPPEGMTVVREMTIKLGLRQRLEPDVLVVAERDEDNLDRTYYLPHEVRLVVEVVSPDSVERDRSTKPIKYSDAGITYLWRVERDGRNPVVYTYELDPAVRAYVPTGVHRGRLKTDIGFDVDLDLTLPSTRA